jgi:hypothetical protein
MTAIGERTIPPLESDERATLTAFLDFQRATLALKCDGLTHDQLRERAVPPSSLSLLGIVRHLAEVERNWFRPVLGSEPMTTIFAPEMDWEASGVGCPAEYLSCTLATRYIVKYSASSGSAPPARFRASHRPAPSAAKRTRVHDSRAFLLVMTFHHGGQTRADPSGRNDHD